MWENVPGQESAIATLSRAALAPVHAYLIAGPKGSGTEAAARCFAAALVCDQGGCGHCSSCQRVLATRHPDVVEIEPEGVTYKIDEVKQIITEAHRSPLESDRKVIMILEAERLGERANTLLKTLEEPPPRVHILVVTSEASGLLDTVRSRCQRVDLAALGDSLVRDLLIAEGVDAPSAQLAVGLGGGQISRARDLVGKFADLREVFVSVPGRLESNGASAARLTTEMTSAVSAAFEATKESLASAREEFEVELSQAGYPDRSARALRKRLAERHHRVERRARIEALMEGLTVLETVYRDALATDAPSLNADRPTPRINPRTCGDALSALSAARTALLERNANETLLMESLLLNINNG